MKKNHKHENQDQEHDAEILKAVAQAWHGHSSSSKSSTETSEFDACKRFFKGKPTRFKIEAIAMETRKKEMCSSRWDFGQSLWDSYEIVSVTKKLERGLMMDSPFSGLDEKDLVGKKRKENKNSLKNLFRMTSRRFNEDDIPLRE